MDIRKLTSSNNDVVKYVFDLGTAVAEAVLYKSGTYNNRTVMCVSTQSGCLVGCRFCGAGDAFVRSLTALEIAGQVDHLLKDNDIDHQQVNAMQIMFMSMGEPMMNYVELSIALIDLEERYPKASLLVSTSGPRTKNYEHFRRLSTYINQIGLQFSIHESTDESRNKLIPLKNKLTLKEIANEGELWHKDTGRRPFFNYCAHENNSSVEDAQRIADLFDPRIWEATISVVCERDETIAEANKRQRELAVNFMNELASHGFSTRCFDPAGQDDIGGGCGQLFHVQNWMRKNADKIHPSVGNGLPIVHSPTLEEV